MKKTRPICLWILVAMVSGCAGPMTLSQATARTREKLLKTSVGMPKEKVMNIVGTKPKEVIDPKASNDQTLATISNPYRSEIIQSNGKNLEVVYYVTDDKDDNGVISNEELTPLVFDEGKMIGWGWAYLVSDDQKFEILVK